MCHEKINSVENQRVKVAIKRMIVGFTIGYLICGGAAFIKLWHDGWLVVVPVFTPPPLLIFLISGSIGGVVGALASLIGKKLQ